MALSWCVSFAAEANSAQSQDLLDVYIYSAANNAQISAAREDFYAKSEAVPQALANLLPAITSSASIDNKRLDRDSPGLVRNRSTSTYQASLKQPLFHAEFWYGLESAQASAAQAALDLSNKEQLLILKVAESYFGVLKELDNLSASASEVHAFESQLLQSKAKLAGGVASITDVYDAQTALDNAVESRIDAERKLGDAYESLAQIAGRPFRDVAGLTHGFPILPPSPLDVTAWVDTALHQNIELQSVNMAIGVAEKTLLSRKAEHLPSLDAVAGYRQGDNDSFGYSNPSDFGRSDYRGRVSEKTLTLELNIPIYSGGRTSSRVREGARRLNESGYLKDDKQREVAMNSRNYFRAVMADIDLVGSRRKTIISSQKSLKASIVSARVGMRNFLDVLNAQRQLYDSVRGYNNSRYDYVLDTIRLKQSAGGLTVADLREINVFLNPNYDSAKDFLPSELE